MGSTQSELKSDKWTLIDDLEYKIGAKKEKSTDGVRKIRKALTEMGLKFYEEVNIKGCKYKKLLLFDFLVQRPAANPVLIEFDGEQHFEYISFFHGRSINGLYKQQERDRVKNRFTEGKVNLLRISAEAMKEGVNLHALLNELVGDKKQVFHGPEYKEGRWYKVAGIEQVKKDDSNNAIVFAVIAGIMTILVSVFKR